MNEISAKYFSTKFIVENKLKLTDIVILEYIYSWILSDNPPECQKESGKKAFYLSQSHIARDFESLITQPAISQKIKRLEKCQIIKTTVIDSIRGRFYVCFNWEKVIESLAPQKILEQQKYKFCSNWFEKIFQYIEEEKQMEQEWKDEWNKKSWHEKIECYKQEEKEYNEGLVKDGLVPKKEGDMLLNKEDMQIEKPKYCKQADAIARRILSKYSYYFQNRIPSEGQKPTKTYVSLCRKIEDIYNGHFISSRFYNFDNNVFENKQFETDGWREKISTVKGDWGKVKQLIFNAVDNFILMFDEQRMPLKKDWLTNSLNDWFFSDNPNSRGQSQFIQSLNEPAFVKNKFGNDKAKNIVENLQKKSPISYKSGHELNELLPVNASELTAWNFINKIIDYGKLLWQFEGNAKYFMQCEIDGNLEAGPKVLPALFARYLKEKKISVSLNTLDIEQSVDNNAPWKWFIEDACRKHDMNMNCVYCFTVEDFYDAYNKTEHIIF